jgi:hypothetical protein
VDIVTRVKIAIAGGGVVDPGALGSQATVRFVFTLLGLPDETGEPLGGAPWPRAAPSPALV